MAAYDRIATYILASDRNGTIYVGVTSDLYNRVLQHKRKEIPGFTADYDCARLVWFEEHGEMGAAIRREKLIKHWLRAWKIDLIEGANLEWRDLSDGWYAESDGRFVTG